MSAIPTVKVLIELYDQNGNPIPAAPITARLTGIEVYQGYILVKDVFAKTDAQGIALMDLWPNALGATQSTYLFRITNPQTGRVEEITASLPNVPAGQILPLHVVANLPPYEGKTDGQIALDAAIAAALPATTAATTAQQAAMQAQNALDTTLPAINAAAQQALNAAAAAKISAQNAASSETVVVSQSSTITLSTNLIRSQAQFTKQFPAYQADLANSQLNQAVLNAANSATQASNSAGAAANQANTATTAATSASNSATTASNAAAGIGTSVTTAQNAATSATNSQNAAATSATNAANSATSASTSATNAASSATNAANSATSASSSASTLTPAVQQFNTVYLGVKTADPTVDNNGAALINGASYFNSTTSKKRLYTGSPLAWGDDDAAALAAATTATNASNSAVAARDLALQYRDAASASADTALTRSTAAGNSASASATSATNSANSASAASNSSGQATVSANNAASSATAAGNSATAAASSQTAAAASATDAANSATAAQTSSSNAGSAQVAAQNSASQAATSATNASNSASAAATSATNASSAASNANSSSASALTSANNAAASYTNFDARYLGKKSAAPTVDNTGAALTVGALYFTTVNNKMQVWNGTAWTDLTGTGGVTDTNAVHLTGDETITAGTKTFSVSPLVPDVPEGDDSTKVVNTRTLRKHGFVLAKSAVKVAGAGNTTVEQTLATIALAANTLGPNGLLRMLVRWSFTGSANQKTWRIRLGGVEVYVNLTSTASNIAYNVLTTTQNRNAANLQANGPSFFGGVSFSGSAILETTVDTTLAQNITITGQCAAAADTINLESYFIEVFPG